EAVAGGDLIVNATPVGMDRSATPPFGITRRWLRAGQFVADLVYDPATTPLLAEARAAGAHATNGLGMLIHQAARQVELWTGRPAPIGVMSAAAVAAISHR
ncbi:MAG: shikimate dehydrogenase, partial [Acidobacteriota bacterium]|nr:shikimate dehydrogenase [Acidobacteriota bacterium]